MNLRCGKRQVAEEKRYQEDKFPEGLEQTPQDELSNESDRRESS